MGTYSIEIDVALEFTSGEESLTQSVTLSLTIQSGECTLTAADEVEDIEFEIGGPDETSLEFSEFICDNCADDAEISYELSVLPQLDQLMFDTDTRQLDWSQLTVAGSYLVTVSATTELCREDQTLILTVTLNCEESWEPLNVVAPAINPR